MDRRLGKNLIYNMGCSLLTMLVPFITAPYLSRALGAERLGEYVYAQSVAAYFVMFGLLGLRNYGNRAIAAVRDDPEGRRRAFSEIYAMQLLTGGAAFLAYAVYALRSGGTVARAVGLYALTAVATLDWYCQGMERFGAMALRSLAVKLLNLACVFLFVRGEGALTAYAVIMSAGYLLSELLLWPTALRGAGFSLPRWRDVARHFRPNLLLFIPAIAASVYQTMDKIMLGAMAGEAELAYYACADRIVSIPSLMITAMGVVLLSRMSHVYARSDDGDDGLAGHAMALAQTIAAACAMGILAVSDALATVYYGADFAPAAPVMRALALSVPFYAWANVLRTQYVIPNGRDRALIGATLAGAAVNLALNALLIPRHRAVGAAVATLAAQLAVAISLSYSVRKALPLRKYLRTALPPWGVGLAMYVAVRLAGRLHGVSVAGLAFDVGFGAALFCGLFWVCALIRRRRAAR